MGKVLATKAPSQALQDNQQHINNQHGRGFGLSHNKENYTMLSKLIPITALVLGTTFTIIGIHHIDGYVGWIYVAIYTLGTHLTVAGGQYILND